MSVAYLPIHLSFCLYIKLLSATSISEPIVYKFKRIVGKTNFSDQFKKIVKRYIRFGYNLDKMRQSGCLVLNPITVYSYGLHDGRSGLRLYDGFDAKL